MWPIIAIALPAWFGAAEARGGSSSAPSAEAGRTVLATRDSGFTVNGKPWFLLGFSYYGALSAPEDFVRKDLDDFQRHGFRWLRVWATWATPGQDVSAVNERGEPREPYLGKLRWLLAECDRRGLVVDVTLTRGKEAPAGGRLPDAAAHQNAVHTLVKNLQAYRNWYLDLANERDVRDDRYVSVAELKVLRDLVRRLDPNRLVTASFGGHDLSLEDVQAAVLNVEVDFLCPHRPRHRGSPAETEAQTVACFQLMRKAGRIVPIHHQEPFRRGYTDWEPSAEDFLTDLRGAVAGGAAGWCFHNGSQRGSLDKEPQRSFDLRTKRLFDQLDAQELDFVKKAARTVAQSAGGQSK